MNDYHYSSGYCSRCREYTSVKVDTVTNSQDCMEEEVKVSCMACGKVIWSNSPEAFALIMCFVLFVLPVIILLHPLSTYALMVIIPIWLLICCINYFRGKHLE